MDHASLHAIAALRPNIRKEWEKLLRAEPPVGPLGNPDTLVYNMDHTLGQLMDTLRNCSDAQMDAARAARNESICRRCDCGMNPLLCYFSVGGIALHAVLGTAIGVQAVTDVLAIFHAIARDEVEVFCRLCRSRRQESSAVRSCGVMSACRAPPVVFEK